jgi:hypothetical protein
MKLPPIKERNPALEFACGISHDNGQFIIVIEELLTWFPEARRAELDKLMESFRYTRRPRPALREEYI